MKNERKLALRSNLSRSLRGFDRTLVSFARQDLGRKTKTNAANLQMGEKQTRPHTFVRPLMSAHSVLPREVGESLI